MSDRVAENVETHDRAAAAYEREHGEIFNEIEQARLRARLAEALAAIRTGAGRAHALDFGAGTGNVTRHLLELGARVTAADVSQRSLNELRRRLPAGAECRTVVLSGGVWPRSSERFDLVALYSVLHHIDDHIALLRELAGLVRPGGVLYLDHEASPAAWSGDPCLEEWRRLGPTLRSRLQDLRQWASWSWLRYRWRRLRHPRATLEGDIHVWPDDHVEWAEVTATLVGAGFEVVSTVDHLQYRRHWDERTYARLRARCADVRSMIARRGR